MIGKLELVLGPMFSGKTTQLIQRVLEEKNRGGHCLCIKYSADCRYSQFAISTHDQKTLDAIPLNQLFSAVPYLEGCSLVAIDEAQFFPDLLSFVKATLAKGINVFACGLDSTFQRTAFPQILDLIPLAKKVIQKVSKCTVTGKPAPFSQRTIESNALVLIGGNDMYRPASRELMTGSKGAIYLFLYRSEANAKRAKNQFRNAIFISKVTDQDAEKFDELANLDLQVVIISFIKSQNCSLSQGMKNLISKSDYFWVE